jgi:antitoxin (DNA-binding transcriptional repressor) of toxin-antitoxin stability system
VAKLVPYQEERVQRRPGALKGKIWIADDFDDDLPAEVLESFYSWP